MWVIGLKFGIVIAHLLTCSIDCNQLATDVSCRASADTVELGLPTLVEPLPSPSPSDLSRLTVDVTPLGRK